MISARKERNGQLAESGRSQFKIIISWTSPNNENNNIEFKDLSDNFSDISDILSVISDPKEVNEIF